MQFHARRHRIEAFALDSGATLAPLELAYHTYGTLSPARDNAVLLLHGISASHHALACADQPANDAGWASGWLGPGSAIDTERFFVVCPNAPGSCFGSSGPRSVDATTGEPYGLRLPHLTIADTVRAQHALLSSLGIERLHAVVGYSYGGYQAFQWAVSYSQAVGRVAVFASAAKGNANPEELARLIALSESTQSGDALAQYRRALLERYGYATFLQDQLGVDAARARLDAEASAWAREFDPASLVALRRAAASFDVTDRLARISAPMLLAWSSSDTLFPSDACRALATRMRDAGCNARTLEVETRYGHAAPMVEPAPWRDGLHEFLQTSTA